MLGSGCTKSEKPGSWAQGGPGFLGGERGANRQVYSPRMEVFQRRCVQVPRGSRMGRLTVLWWSGDTSWERGSRTALKEEGKTGARSDAERAGDTWEIMGNTGQGKSEISEVNREAPWKTAFLHVVPWPDLTKGSDISLCAALPSMTLPHPLTGLFLPRGWMSWDTFILTAASQQDTSYPEGPGKGRTRPASCLRVCVTPTQHGSGTSLGPHKERQS